MESSPTPAQRGRLICDIEAILYDELDEAKRTGAIIKEDALKAAISEEIVGKAVSHIETRQEASKAIYDYSRYGIIPMLVKDAIDGFLSSYDVEINYAQPARV